MNKQHTTQFYCRSNVLSYFELTATQQINVVSNYFNTKSEAEKDTFVIIPDHSPLPLSMFIRYGTPWNPTNNKVWDGFYGTSYFSAYFIKLDKYGETAIICERTY